MKTRPPELRRWWGPLSSEPPPSWSRTFLMPALLVATVAAILLTFFLSIYPVKGYTVPIGWDQSEYLWRTALAREVGFENIDRPLPAVPNPKAGRPAFPVITASLSSVGGVHPFRVAMVLPSAMAATIGLAAGAFVAGVLRRPMWELAAVALAVSFSAVVGRLMRPEAYMDTMFTVAVFLAASVPLALSLEHRGAVIPATLLLAASGIIHWSFFAVIAAIVLLTGGALLPESWRRWRSRDAALLDTPTARLGQAVLGSTVLAGVTIAGVMGSDLPSPRVDVSEFVKKLRRDLPKYRFPITLPLAGLGAIAVASGARSRTADRDRDRFILFFLLAWCAVVLGGYLARTVLHLSIPAHRFLSFAVPIPILGILGILAIGRLVARRVPLLGAVGIGLALTAAGVVAHVQWFQARPLTDASKIRDAATAQAYLGAAGVPIERPVVFIVSTTDWSAAALWGHMIRAALPADRIPRAYVYVGSAEEFLARRPAQSALSRSYFTRVEPLYGANPVAVLPLSFNRSTYDRWVSAHPETEIDSRVAVVQGPPPPEALPDLEGVGPPVGPIPWWMLGLLAAGSMAVLGLTGLGWIIAGLGQWLRPAEVIALSPAVGVAGLVVGGSIADVLGVRLEGVGGALVPILIASLGAGLAIWVRARRKASMPVPPA
jgi:hypothetical protein